jgi:hypothetical protein
MILAGTLQPSQSLPGPIQHIKEGMRNVRLHGFILSCQEVRHRFMTDIVLEFHSNRIPVDEGSVQ